jgi:glutamine synthetase
MHVHQSLWTENTNCFYDGRYAQISDTAKYYIGGLLKHSSALLALAHDHQLLRAWCRVQSSSKLAYSQRNRSAICRIPVYSKSPKAKRVEFCA